MSAKWRPFCFGLNVLICRLLSWERPWAHNEDRHTKIQLRMIRLNDNHDSYQLLKAFVKQQCPFLHCFEQSLRVVEDEIEFPKLHIFNWVLFTSQILSKQWSKMWSKASFWFSFKVKVRSNLSNAAWSASSCVAPMMANADMEFNRAGIVIRRRRPVFTKQSTTCMGKPQQPRDSLVYVGGWRCAATRIHYRNYFAHKLCWFVVISSYICKPTVRFVMFVVCMMSAMHLIWVSCQYIEVDFAYEFVAIVATGVLEAVLVRCSLTAGVRCDDSEESDWPTATTRSKQFQSRWMRIAWPAETP